MCTDSLSLIQVHNTAEELQNPFSARKLDPLIAETYHLYRIKFLD